MTPATRWKPSSTAWPSGPRRWLPTWAPSTSCRPPAGEAGSWQERTAAVERELERRFGHTPQLAAATGQSHRIGYLLEVGQLASQVLPLTRE